MINKDQTSTIWPNLFIVGAAKAGTTTLFEHLRGHRQVFMSPVKEPHFFSEVADKRETLSYDHWINWIATEEEYLQLFADATGFPITGEASTSYLWAPGTPERIKSKVPDASIIVMLRDPVERAYSHYLMDVRTSRQPLPFYDALLEDFTRERKGWHISNLYVELGLYYQQLLPYWQTFERDKLLILTLDEMKDHPANALRKVATFLNIDYEGFSINDSATAINQYLAPTNSLQFVHNNPMLRQLISRLIPLSLRATVRNRYFLRPAIKPTIDPKAVDFLSDLYSPDIKALERLLGQDLPGLKGDWWHA
jgi:hypothetical protein